MTACLPSQDRLKKLNRELLLNRAAPLAERLAGNYQVPTGWQAGTESRERLERWRKLVEAGMPGQFERRLAQDALSVRDLAYLLSDDFRFEEMPGDAGWLRLIEMALVENAAVLADLKTLPEAEKLPYGFIDPENPVLFEEALAGFVRLAVRELQAKAGTAYELLSDEARRDLAAALLVDLMPLTTSLLSEEFLKFRLAQPGALLFTLKKPVESVPSRQVYRRFVENLLADGWLDLFEKYSALARLLGIFLSDWITATAEGLTRLAADFPALQTRFGLTTAQLARYASSGSDAHNGHRGVAILTFEDGQKLVYKPRNLGAEEAYAEFLHWLNGQGLSLDLKTYGIFNRESYGWVEFVEAAPCLSEEEVAAFYRRAGMLLAVFYLLGTVDCHQENIIACGAYPIMIDAEAVMTYQVKAAALQEEDGPGYEFLEESVLRTHLLPFWVKNALGSYSDISGLSLGRTTETVTTTSRTWEHINTDLMRKVNRSVTAAIEPDRNVPRLAGQVVSPAPYLGVLVEGFNEVYRLFVQKRAEMLAAESGALALLQGREIRLIFRATQTYAGLLYNSYHPSALRNGVDRSIELDVLSRGLLAEDTLRFWQVLPAEIAALERGDIPLFNCLSDKMALYLPGGQTLAGFAAQSAYAAVRQRLAEFGETDLARQIGFIKNSFYTVSANPLGVKSEVSQSITGFKPTFTGRAELVAEACRIADRLEGEAIVAKNGGLDWLAPELVPDGHIYTYKVLGQSLYSGTSGIALFLAALYRVTGRDNYRRMSLNALKGTRAILKNQNRLNQLVRYTGIGGSFGVGSLVYALTKVGQLLDEPALLDDAALFAAQITPEMIAADRTYDVMLGSAGAILGLLALHQARPDRRWLEAAGHCGAHLLSGQQSNGGWATYAGNPGLSVSGFAHGASGIGLALAKLSQATANPAFAKGALAALEFEATRFDADRQNWASPLTEDDSNPYFGVAWCHGAVGVGLARLALLAQTGYPGFKQEAEIAVQTTLKTGLHSFDQLCCGTAGRVELLVQAAQTLNRPNLLATARAWAGQMVRRAGENGGHYRFMDGTPLEVSSPGLFQGLAGVGYELLRAAYPARVPSIAIWK